MPNRKKCVSPGAAAALYVVCPFMAPQSLIACRAGTRTIQYTHHLPKRSNYAEKSSIQCIPMRTSTFQKDAAVFSWGWTFESKPVEALLEIAFSRYGELPNINNKPHFCPTSRFFVLFFPIRCRVRFLLYSYADSGYVHLTSSDSLLKGGYFYELVNAHILSPA